MILSDPRDKLVCPKEGHDELSGGVSLENQETISLVLIQTRYSQTDYEHQR
jgi:hypothetical protein